MKFAEQITKESRFLVLQDKNRLSHEELGELIRYPFKSLASYCSDLTSSEVKKIKKIEEVNILYFFNAMRIILGHGSAQEKEIFKRNLSKEPLKTAILMSKLQQDIKLQYISFVKNACKIILTKKQKEINRFIEPINVQIFGSMPRNILKSRQQLGDKWYNDFIDNKLLLFEKLVLSGIIDDIFPLISMSIAYSVYFYSPEKYYISEVSSENDIIFSILEKFITLTSEINL